MIMYGYGKTINIKDYALTFLFLAGLVSVFIFQIPSVYAETSKNYAGSVLANPWSGEAAAIGAENKMCATSKAGEAGYWQNFDFDIPDKSKITGIEVLIDSSQSKSENYLIVQVGKASKTLGATEIKVTPASGSCASSTGQSVGGPAELWGLKWNAEEINSKTFGVQLKSGMENSQVQLDSIGIVVHYVSSTGAEKPIIVYTGPTNLVATTLSQSIIDLSWSPPTDHSKIKNYIIERKLHGQDDFAVIDTISPQFLKYSDAGLLGNTEYVYRVSVIDSQGKKSSSNEDSATTFAFMNKIIQGDSTAPSANKINFFNIQNGTETLELSNKLVSYSNKIPKQIFHTGVEKRVQISVSDNDGIAALKHVGILMYPGFDDDKKNDTYFVYDEGSGLTISDPLGIFGDVQVHRTFTKTEMLLTFTFTPQKPMPLTDVVINSWDDELNSKNTIIPAAFEIQGEPVSNIVSALSTPVSFVENAKPKYVIDKDGNMIPYDSFGNLDNKFLRTVAEPFVYPSKIGKLHRTDDGFYDKVSEERVKAKKIADLMIKSPFSEPENKKIDKVFKYPKDVGKTDRRDVQSIKAMMEKENTKAQKENIKVQNQK
ncbi:MAG TPA: fibronectin type III domain-containing protein [Nitrosopumilaceae archaeon]|nr:fibronectin type III domain-containing protein [Nitrosopumilaceae archaeon]